MTDLADKLEALLAEADVPLPVAADHGEVMCAAGGATARDYIQHVGAYVASGMTDAEAALVAFLLNNAPDIVRKLRRLKRLEELARAARTPFLRANTWLGPDTNVLKAHLAALDALEADDATDG